MERRPQAEGLSVAVRPSVPGACVCPTDILRQPEEAGTQHGTTAKNIAQSQSELDSGPKLFYLVGSRLFSLFVLNYS